MLPSGLRSSASHPTPGGKVAHAHDEQRHIVHLWRGRLEGGHFVEERRAQALDRQTGVFPGAPDPMCRAELDAVRIERVRHTVGGEEECVAWREENLDPR